jgi:hypothetical protein
MELTTDIVLSQWTGSNKDIEPMSFLNSIKKYCTETNPYIWYRVFQDPEEQKKVC